MNKKVKIGIIVGVLLLVGGGGAACVAGMANNIAAVENMADSHATETVEKKDVSNYVSASGTVQGINSVKIAPPANSKVLELNTELGSAVKKDELLCVFDDSDLQSEYDNLKKKYKLSEDQTDNTHEKNERALTTAKEDKDIAVKNAQDALNKARDERNIAVNDAADVLNKAKKERDKAYNEFDDKVKKYNDKVKTRNRAYDNMMEAEYEDKEQFYQKYTSLDAELEVEEKELDAQKAALAPLDDAVNAAQKAYDSAVRQADQLVTDAKKAYDAAVRQADQAVQAVQDVIDAEKFTVDDTVKEQIKELKEKIADCQVKAPIDGVVTALGIAEGGLPEGTSILTIEDTETLKINVDIKEKDIMNIHEGMKAEITATALPDKTFSGTDSRVVLVPTVTPGAEGGTSSNYTAEVTIDDKDSGLLLGMNAKVKIVLSEKKDTIAVPMDAIVEDENGNFVVFIAEGTSPDASKCTAKAAKVRKELETDYYVAVSSDELKESDVIILDAEGLKDGDSVNISTEAFDFGGDDK